MQRPGQHLRRERLLRAEGRLERDPEAVEERDPRRGLRIEDMCIGQVRDRRQNADRARGGPELGPPPQRLARRRDEHSGAAWVAVGRAQGRAARVGCDRARAAAARGEQAGTGDKFAERLTPGDLPGHPLSPCTTASLVAR